MARLFQDLKRRNVFRVGTVYAIVAWLLVEIASVILPTFNAPEWVMQAFVILVALAFPIALLLAWAFEITPTGIKWEKEVEAAASIAHITGRKLDFAIIGLLVIVVAFLAIDGYVLDVEPEQPPAVRDQLTSIERSIAVLPFVNMSSDPEQDYFSDGLSEEILNLLAKTPSLKVISRTSSFAFKGQKEDLRTIGQALGVSTVLEGSVRKSGERVRITAQLVDVSSGAHIWSETYDRTLTDIFTVQDSVASAIIGALQVHVAVSPTRGRPTDDFDAYALFLRARAAMNETDSKSARELLLQAIELDPMFAEAHELLAASYWYQTGEVRDSAGAYRRLRNAAAKALAIAPDLVFAQALLVAGDGPTDRFGYLKELEAFERVVIKEPSNSAAADALAWDLLFAGFTREALRIAERNVDLDPLSPLAQLRLSQSLIGAGSISDARVTLELAAQLGSDWANFCLGVLHLIGKRDEDAIASLEVYLQLRGLPATGVSELIVGARDPATGLAHLNQRFSQIVASVPEDRSFEMRFIIGIWYLGLGFLDQFYELVADSELHFFLGTIFRSSGFTAHPRYLEATKTYGLIELWEQRGPPDFCQKVDDQWACE